MEEAGLLFEARSLVRVFQIFGNIERTMILFMIATGFALYSEGAGHGHWSDLLFGWVLVALGDSQTVHSLHRLGLWVLLSFIFVHVYAALREDIMSRQSIISTMISGWRSFRD